MFAEAMTPRDVPRPGFCDTGRSVMSSNPPVALFETTWAGEPLHLLPERALAGDPLARSTLVNRVYRPLQDQSPELMTTLWCYLDNGRSLEATARELFVHPNTVRYRLKRISEVIGWDATGAREALILQSALIIGSIAEPDPKVKPAR